MEPADIPAMNAVFNAISSILLVTGFCLIKQGKQKLHRYVMTGALVSSALFLTGYVYYHYKVGHVEFPAEYPLARKIYLSILIPHILLAVINLPLIIILVTAAFRGNFKLHKRFARFTLPSWLFVSVTGVVVYLMIYQWFLPEDVPKQAPERAGSVILKSKAVSGSLTFSPAVQKIHVAAGVPQVKTSIRVTNSGKAPVTITKLESGCSCLAVSMEKRRIGPGETALITGVFETGRLSGEAEKRIQVGTDQKGDHDTFLFIKLDVDPLYTISDSMTSWQLGEPPDTKTVTFRVTRKKPIHILKVTSSKDQMGCEWKTIEDGRRYEIALTPKSTASRLLGMVRIETDCELQFQARPLAFFCIQ